MKRNIIKLLALALLLCALFVSCNGDVDDEIFGNKNDYTVRVVIDGKSYYSKSFCFDGTEECRVADQPNANLYEDTKFTKLSKFCLMFKNAYKNSSSNLEIGIIDLKSVDSYRGFDPITVQGFDNKKDTTFEISEPITYSVGTDLTVNDANNFSYSVTLIEFHKAGTFTAQATKK